MPAELTEDERREKYGHIIEQPSLRELEKNERYIRTMGLRFIATNRFKAGDVLDEDTALFINSAWHTAALNRFGPLREALLERGDNLTYEAIDAELQAHMEEFDYTPRVLKSDGTDDTSVDEGLRAVISFGRPHFNKAVQGHGWTRTEYEAKLREWATENRTMLEGMMKSQKSTIQGLIEAMTRSAD